MVQAVILAGGFGTRLKDVVNELPKPMAPIGDKPFLAVLIEHLAEQGVTEVVLSVHYMGEKIEEYFGKKYNGTAINYVYEDVPLGTGGAIVHALKTSKPKEPVIVLNGDTFVKLNIKDIYAQHVQSSATLTMALREVPNCSRYGEVIVEEGSIVSFYDEGSDGAGFINAGIYVIDPDFFDNFSLNRNFSFERDFLYQHISDIQIEPFIADGYFIDIGIPEDYARARDELPAMVG